MCFVEQALRKQSPTAKTQTTLAQNRGQSKKSPHPPKAHTRGKNQAFSFHSTSTFITFMYQCDRVYRVPNPDACRCRPSPLGYPRCTHLPSRVSKYSPLSLPPQLNIPSRQQEPANQTRTKEFPEPKSPDQLCFSNMPPAYPSRNPS